MQRPQPVGEGFDFGDAQAVEQAATLRMIPRMSLWRPCDAVESAVAWKVACEKSDGPTSLLFSRQGLPHIDRNTEQLANIERGGYILSDCEGDPAAILIATGSEVELAMGAQQLLAEKGINARVVSMPSTDVFDAQDTDYREAVLPASVRQRVAIEAGVSDYWRKYVGLDGDVVGIDTFGESGPAGEVFQHFGFTAENVAARVEQIL